MGVLRRLGVMCGALLVVLSAYTANGFGTDVGGTDVVRLSMRVARTGHSMIELRNHNVLVVGGGWSDLGGVGDLERFIPWRRTFVKTKATLLEPRMGASATLLSSGEVLVVGGATDSEMALASAELVGAGGDSTRRLEDMATARSGHTATLLPNGKVLIVGGHDGESSLDSAELFDPATGRFSTLAARMATPRSDHTATLIGERLILITGGENDSASQDSGGEWRPLATAEVFDITADQFEPTRNSMAHGRIYHQATVLDGDTVLLSGGLKGLADGSQSADRFDAARLMFEPAAAMLHKRSSHTATLLANGNALLCGGVENGAATASCELFETRQNRFREVSSLDAPRWSHAATPLSNGDILISGGMSNDIGAAGATWGPSMGALIYRLRE
jgi:hypothetical protein